MPMESFLPMLALALAAAWTPGPNNALLAASGARFGLRQTMPHVLGVGLGFPVMVLIVGLVLAQAFQTSQWLQQGLKWGGAALLLWMGWKIATAGRPGQRTATERPFSFLGAAAFQWINPKGWVMAVSITSLYLSRAAPVQTAAIIAGTFVLAGLSSAFGWAWLGQLLSRWLGDGPRLRLFNLVMGAMVAMGAAALFLE